MYLKKILIGTAALALVGCGAYTPTKDKHPAAPLEWGNDVSWEYEFIGSSGKPIDQDAMRRHISWEYDFSG